MGLDYVENLKPEWAYYLKNGGAFLYAGKTMKRLFPFFQVNDT